MKISAINGMSSVPTEEHVLVESSAIFEWFRQTLGSGSIAAEVLEYEYAEVAGCCILDTLVVYSEQ